MGIGIFYCHRLPMFDLAEIDWLRQKPVRDWELEEDLGEEVWMVEYDTAHPDMHYEKRYYTCVRHGFLGVTFEDEALLDDRCAIFPHLATSLPKYSINPVPISFSLPLLVEVAGHGMSY